MMSGKRPTTTSWSICLKRRSPAPWLVIAALSLLDQIYEHASQNGLEDDELASVYIVSNSLETFLERNRRLGTAEERVLVHELLVNLVLNRQEELKRSARKALIWNWRFSDVQRRQDLLNHES